jgi:hypothetical protein
MQRPGEAVKPVSVQKRKFVLFVQKGLARVHRHVKERGMILMADNTLRLPIPLWKRLSALATNKGQSPEELGQQFISEAISRQEKAAEPGLWEDYISWHTALEIGREAGRAWTTYRSALNFVNIWNAEHSETDPLHIRRRSRHVHRDDLVRALQNSQRWKGE